MLTKKRLKEVLDYDPESGIFRWKSRPVIWATRRTDNGFNTRMAGRIAGSDGGKGYIVIEIDAVGYKAHRLAWFYVHRRWPADQIDHANRNRSDNSIQNLREASPSQNDINGSRKRNIAPYRGLGYMPVANHNKPWMAKISVNGNRVYLGYYATAEEAYEVYCEAAKKYHGEFASFD